MWYNCRASLSVDTVGLLVYFGVSSVENVMATLARNVDVTPATRAHRVAVRALLELLLTVKYFSGCALRPDERYVLRTLQR